MSIPFIRNAQRVCNYCKGIGHNDMICPEFRSKKLIMLGSINIIVASGHDVERKLIRFLDMFHTVQELCLLIKSIMGLKEYIRLLVINGSITETQSRMRLKKDRILVLTWLYWYSSTMYKNQQERNKKVVIKSPETVTDLSEFECPICVCTLPASEKVETDCKHCVCKGCMVGYLEHRIHNMDFSKPRCSMCRTDITELTVFNINYLTELSEIV
jgi:hypothetical protein